MGESRSFGAGSSRMRQGGRGKRVECIPRVWSELGDVGLPRHSRLAVSRFNGELSRVGHFPDEAALNAVSRMKKKLSQQE
jgi:hypothetical protein